MSQTANQPIVYDQNLQPINPFVEFTIARIGLPMGIRIDGVEYWRTVIKGYTNGVPGIANGTESYRYETGEGRRLAYFIPSKNTIVLD